MRRFLAATAAAVLLGGPQSLTKDVAGAESGVQPRE